MKTHVYCSHINVQSASSDADTGTSSAGFQCPHCDKIASNKDALDQHIGAKHGLHSDIKPAWAQVNRKSSDLSVEGTLPCTICGLLFKSNEELQAHLDHGFIPQNLELNFMCSNCGKQFSDERGKLQHENFCVQKAGHLSKSS